MGAHVGAARSHSTGRRTSLMLRAFTALFGHMGIEADVRDFSQAERARLADAIALYKRFRPLLHGGRTLRLDLADPGAIAFAVVGEADTLVSFAQLETPVTALPETLRIPGREAGADYRITLLTAPRQRPGRPVPVLVAGDPITASGALIDGMGIAPPILQPGGIAVLHLERIG